MYWSAAMCINGFYLVVLEYEREREVREGERQRERYYADLSYWSVQKPG